MKRVQVNYLNMAKGTVVVFCNHADAWNEEPLIDGGVQKISALIGKIELEAVKQKQHSTPGYTAVKDQQREVLEERLFRTGGRMKVYAVRTGDKLVASQVSFSRSVLGNMSLNVLLTTARTVVAAAVELGDALLPFKVTADDVKELQEAVDATEEMNAMRDAAQGEHVENTSHLSVLFTQLRDAFKEMDVMVDAYVVDEEFRVAYFSTRRIHDVGAGNVSGSQEAR